MKKIISFVLFSIVMLSAAYADSTPVIVSFQGQLRENGIPVSGNKTMHFRILDVSSNVIWQSNATLTNQVTVTVTNGIYTVGLGDTSLSNMAALLSSDLDQNKKLFLRVRVGIEDLSPDILLSAVPFAYIAKQAEVITQNISAGNSVALALRQATQNVGIGNTNPINLLQVSINALVVSANGRVGIGTTNVQEQLDVAGRIRLNQTTTPGTTTDKLYNVGGNLFWNGVTVNTVSGTNYWSINSANIFYPSGNVGVTSTTPTNLFQVSANYLVVSANGLIGIGTTAPSHSLHIVNGKLQITHTGTSGAVILNRTDGKYMAMRAGTAGGFFSYEDTGFFAITKESTANLVIGAGNLANATLVSDINGYVGIGTIAPSNLFQVSSNAFSVSQNGYVGVGTASPQETLHVSGSVLMGTFGATPNVTANRLYNVSGNLFWNGSQLGSSTETIIQGTLTIPLVKTVTANTATFLVDTTGVTAIFVVGGTGGNQNLGLTAGELGQMLIIVGNGGTGTPRLQDNTANGGAVPRLGGATRSLTQGKSITLIFNGSEWIELAFGNN